MPPRVGEREHAEERDGQPEEMERGLPARLPHANRGADQQSQQTDGREQKVGGQGDRGDPVERDGVQPRLVQTQQRVVDRRTFGDRAQYAQQVGVALDRLAPGSQQHVPGFDPGQGRRGLRRHRLGQQAVGALAPEHAVVHAATAGANDRVGDCQAQQRRDDADGEQGPAPFAPKTARVDLALSALHDDRESMHANHTPHVVPLRQRTARRSERGWGHAACKKMDFDPTCWIEVFPRLPARHRTLPALKSRSERNVGQK